MWRDKSPGLKILWIWTFGTAAVLVTNVMRTRMRDMEEIVNAQHHDPPQSASTAAGDSSSAFENASPEFVEDKS